MSKLKRWRALSAQRALRMTGQLVRIVDLLEGNGIEVIPLKGPLLAQDLYGDATMRTSADLDLLVRPGDAAAARSLLLAVGFDDAVPYNERLLRRGTRSEGQMRLQRRGGELLVELHWRCTVAFSTHAITAERLFAGARTVDLLGRPVRAPGPVDQVLLLALHGSRHDWCPLELRLAVAVLVARLPADAWPGLCATARELGCLRRLLVGVVHACRPFGVSVPHEVGRLVARDRVAPAYTRHLRAVAGAQGSHAIAGSTATCLAVLWWSVRAEDHLVDTLGHLLARSFLPGPEDWQVVHLPQRLDWLYWGIRPVRLAAKYGSRVARRAAS
jgi:hypothetical protein